MGSLFSCTRQSGLIRKVWRFLRAALSAAVAHYAHHMRHHGLHHLLVSIGVANVVLLTEPLWVSLEDVASTYAHKAAAAVVASRSESSAFRNVAIVKIDKERFASPSHYAGTSPLDRCQLAKDLAVLLNLGQGSNPDASNEARKNLIRFVAVDLDLSPIERSEFDKVLLSDVYQSRLDNTGRLETMDRAKVALACQKRLDGLIRDNADRLLLMAPTAGLDKEINSVIEEWVRKMELAKVQFATVELRETRGLLRYQFRAEEPDKKPRWPYFGDVIHQRIQPPPSTQSLSPLVVAQRTPIALHALGGFFDQGRNLDFNDACLLPRFKPCGFNVILFGAGYSADDEYETPHGTLHGVDVHAANGACPAPSHAQAMRGRFRGHALEVLAGVLVLAPLMQFFWSRYYRVRSGKHMAEVNWQQRLNVHGAYAQGAAAMGRRTVSREFALVRLHSAYVWLWMMAVVLGFLWLLASLLAPLGASICTVVGIPAAFVIGMMVEGAAVQSVQVAVHEMQAEQDSTPLALPRAQDGAMPVFTLYRAVFWGSYLLLLGCAVVKLVHGP